MKNNSANDTAAMKRLLDTFLVDNDDLAKLNGRLGTFDLFRVLRIERAEIRHSNVLAWLLTPGETHGLGDVFLRRFLSRLLLENDGIDVRLTPAQVELTRFDDVEVLREWKHIDILVRSRNDPWCLVIENKIGSKESPGQLRKYADIVKSELPGYEVIPVYLTLEGDEPADEGEDPGFIPLSHAQVLELADTIVSQNRSRIPEDAMFFLKHYLATLRRVTMEDQELVDLCKRIYQKHRSAIDLIVEYGTSSRIMDACEAAIVELVQCEFVLRKGSAVWFLPKDMAKYLPAVPLNGWQSLPRSVAIMCWCHFKKKNSRLQFLMEVGPIADADMRIRLLTEIRAAGFSFGKKALERGAKFTRLLSETKTIQVDEEGQPRDDTAYIHGVVKSQWDKLWGKGAAICGVLKELDWPKEA